MYISTIDIKNYRTFSSLSKPISFASPDKEWNSSTKPKLPNVNLLLGNNGSGKTSLLKAIALTAMGPFAEKSGVNIFSSVRNITGNKKITRAELSSSFMLHQQDVEKSQHKVLKDDGDKVDYSLQIVKQGEVEFIEDDQQGSLKSHEPELWSLIFESDNAAFFVVGYGATRRVEAGENLDMGARSKSRHKRVQRIQGLFEDSYSLIPLSYWLPEMKHSNPGRYKQVINLFERITGAGHYKLTEEIQNGDYLYAKGKIKVPFQALSDGYKAFFGWLADMLYHVCYGCPSGQKLVDNKGIVLVDEIDLHLHPKWQMSVVQKMAKALPNIQFIFTSHSPLILGALESENIINLEAKSDKTLVSRPTESIHGMDADQILLSDLFGLKTTRSRSKVSQINALQKKALRGDEESALELLHQLSKGR